MGKDYNWEVDKYATASKSADVGNRRRFIKNIARFIKNPSGYVYWKTYLKAENHNKIRQLWALLLVFGVF